MMSSHSPRGSLSGASTSAEVAADFEESLKDLQVNNRYEISNLTIIAKENTEHAQAISRALENHIKTTSPSRKLPALFVLDSIVKNVGTPYTVYLGRNLYSIFMDAYTLVDGNTRRNMEGMLKTWKERVPGAIDPRPVFPPDTVRPIENALLKAKTAALQSQRPPHGQPQVAYRATATPPQHNGQYHPPPQANQQHPYGMQQPTPQPQQYPPSQPSYQEVEAVKRDIDMLIQTFQRQLAPNPHDPRLRSQLAALQALHEFLSTKSVSAMEFQSIKAQVSSMTPALAAPQPTPQPPTPQWQTPAQYPPYQQPPTGFPPPQSFTPQTNGPPAPAPNPLAGLQALLANAPKPSTPQLRAAMPDLRNASHSQMNSIQNHAVAPSVNGAADLIASLTKAGLINVGPNSTPLPPSAPPAALAPPADPTAALLKSLQSILPTQPPQGAAPQLAMSPMAATSQVPISAASLKVFRPELIYKLYDGQPNQCSTCGRRFLATEEGRQAKNRHLDWHFRTNQRIADPALNRGHHRNWYVDEMEWIRHVEFDPSTTTATAGDAQAAAKAKKGPQDQSVRAPAGMTKNTCNICFEEMKSSYSEDLQDWIFTNATVHNGRIVHVTCLAEMSKGQGGAGGAGGSLAAALASVSGGGRRDRSATPDSLLGKRKAEQILVGGGARVKTE
ncbi:mRNA cleavage factor complex component Pcf11 like protein [Zymoseptoria brevis]|uniref:mRNA cleavage factor complex component Pcf11 like protein n=1 Tax=Zymoseptoria brevis TaxID=1047168 RepID=A0A0F4GFL9_9PEZI|nr:mRNA cleavage factor complex component Pcf11 like protein [Zymoseptoria brevis]